MLFPLEHAEKLGAVLREHEGAGDAGVELGGDIGTMDGMLAVHGLETKPLRITPSKPKTLQQSRHDSIETGVAKTRSGRRVAGRAALRLLR
jgi:hypothetical protein